MNNLDCSFVLGSTGLGIDFSSFIIKDLKFRVGFDYVPTFDYDMNFNIQVGDDPSTSSHKFEKMSGFLKGLTSYDVNQSVIMVGSPSFHNFKFLFDVYPFHNKHWRITAGAYLGQRRIAETINSMEDMHSLMGVDIYNNIYYKLEHDEMIFEDYDIDPDTRDQLFAKMKSYGRMGINMGQFSHDMDITDKRGEVHHYKEGDTYFMEPDVNGTVWATAKTNLVKPYLGVGYEGMLIPGNDMLSIAFDCGAMFWGGVPDITTHDGVDLIDDLTNVRGDVDKYLKAAKLFPVYPVLNLRICMKLY